MLPDCFLVDGHQLPVVGFGGVFLLVDPAGVRPHHAHFLGVPRSPADPGGEVLRIAGGEVQPRDPVLHDFRHGAQPRGDHGQPLGERLFDRSESRVASPGAAPILQRRQKVRLFSNCNK